MQTLQSLPLRQRSWGWQLLCSWVIFCHSQATVSFVPTRTSVFLGISGFLGIWGSWASEDYTSQCDLESSKVLSRDLELRQEKAIVTKSTMPEKVRSGDFGKPHAFLVKVYQRPVFMKRMSLRLVLWNWDGIYTKRLEVTRMFKGSPCECIRK